MLKNTIKNTVKTTKTTFKRIKTLFNKKIHTILR